MKIYEKPGILMDIWDSGIKHPEKRLGIQIMTEHSLADIYLNRTNALRLQEQLRLFCKEGK